jgi:ankyrin repeat protein
MLPLQANLNKARTQKNMSHRNDWNRTPLMYAAYFGETELVRSMLARGADPDAEDTNERTALMAASIQGHTEVVELLLKAGANPNKKDSPSGGTALMAAIAANNPDIVRLLCTHGADPSIKADNKMNARQFAEATRSPTLHIVARCAAARTRRNNTPSPKPKGKAQGKGKGKTQSKPWRR